MLYLPDGTAREVQPANGKTHTLKELQALVGGYIEIISPSMFPEVGQIMVVNEDGLAKGLPYNTHASFMCRGTRIVGPALVCRTGEIK